MSDVTKTDIVDALRRLGIAAGDVVMVHSSMKSFGRVEGGAQTIIDAFEEVLTREGTLAMPTLCQGSVVRAYENWYMDKPSDVGYLTEYFRKQMYVYRSDHPTHSAAARGKRAYELTETTQSTVRGSVPSENMLWLIPLHGANCPNGAARSSFWVSGPASIP